MDPYSLAILGLAKATMEVIHEALIAWNNAPAEVRDKRYARLEKMEALGDPILDALHGVLAKLKPPTP